MAFNIPVTTVGTSAALPLDGRVVLDAGLLKRLRKARGISQEALAELCFNRHLCVSIASIKRAETGKPVLYRTARHLALIFELDPGALAAGKAPLLPVTHAAPAPPYGVTAPLTDVGTDLAVTRIVLELHVALAEPVATAMHQDEQLAQLISRFGGVSDGQVKDGWSVVHFGLPQAYRSDSERALLCGLALCASGFVLPGKPIVLQLAPWTGQAVPVPPALHQFATAETWPADQPRRAALYVAANLTEQLSVRAEFAPAAPGMGFYRCLRWRPFEADSPRSLAGRAIEVLQFKGIIEATQECQNGHIVYLRGMAGVGKSRLLMEFADIARQGEFACHHADVLDFGMDNWYAPLGQLARSLLGLDQYQLADLGQGLMQALARLKLPAEHAIFLRMLVGAPFEPTQLALYAAIDAPARAAGKVRALQSLLLRRALVQPLLVTVEDLQWGDARLFPVLGDLLACTDDAPVIWVLSSRTEGDPLDSAMRPRFSNPLSLLDLGPMRQREASALAEQFTTVAPAYRAECIARAQGNPLYLTQLLSDPKHSLPDSLRHLVQSRLDRLAPLHRRALGLAAVIGNRFEVALLRLALAEPAYQPERVACQSLIREIEPGRYMFVHDLVMHCIYDAMALACREQAHRTVAYCLRETHPALSAQHLLRANDPAAFDALLAAMCDKLRLCQYDAILDMAQQCDRFSSRAAGSFSLALWRAHGYAGVGQTARARLYFQRAMLLAQTADEKIAVALGLAPVLNTLDSLDEEEQLLELTVPLARQRQADAALARLFYLQGNLYFPRGDYARCRQHHEQALLHARSAGAADTEVRAISGIGDSWYAQGCMAQARVVFEQCISLCESRGLLSLEAANRSARGSAYIYLGEPALALADAVAAAQRACDVGDRRAEIFSRLTTGWILLAGAQQQRARGELEAALALARSMGATRFEAIVLEGLARIAFDGGQQALAESLIQEAAALVERLQLGSFIGPWIWGSLALIANDQAVRRQALARSRAQLARGCLAHNGLRFHVAAAEINLLDGDFAQAADAVLQMRAGIVGEPCAWMTQHASLVGTASAWLQSPGADELALLRRAVEESARLGYAATMPRLMHRLALER